MEESETRVKGDREVIGSNDTPLLWSVRIDWEHELSSVVGRNLFVPRKVDGGKRVNNEVGVPSTQLRYITVSRGRPLSNLHGILPPSIERRSDSNSVDGSVFNWIRAR